MAILDQYGNPIDRVQLAASQYGETATHSLAHSLSRESVRGITPHDLNRILDQGLNGNLTKQALLFEMMQERDTHIAGEFDKRKGAPLALPWEIKPPPTRSPKRNAWPPRLTSGCGKRLTSTT